MNGQNNVSHERLAGDKTNKLPIRWWYIKTRPIIDFYLLPYKRWRVLITYSLGAAYDMAQWHNYTQFIDTDIPYTSFLSYNIVVIRKARNEILLNVSSTEMLDIQLPWLNYYFGREKNTIVFNCCLIGA